MSRDDRYETKTSAIEMAASHLRAGRCVAMPTETVYGLAASIVSREGIERIFQLKERPSFDPLIVHIAEIDQAEEVARKWTSIARDLAQAFWPGPLTLVLPRRLLINEMITSGLDTVGIRMPRHELALELIRKTGAPLAAPSANRFGRTSPTTVDHVRSEFPEAVASGEIFVLDGGQSEIGLESTVVSVTENEVTILRPGAVTKLELEGVAGRTRVIVGAPNSKAKTASPGHTEHHYMPKKPLIVFWGSAAEVALHRESLSGFQVKIDGQELVGERIGDVILSHDSRLAARELYAAIRNADLDTGVDAMIIYREKSELDPSANEIWEAIDDRLKRASRLRLGDRPQ